MDWREMKIIHAVTADDPFGEPWPPYSDDIWHVVRRSRGFTVWRAIQPNEPATTATPDRPIHRRHTKGTSS
jgi:hypothetical protein